MRKCNVCGKEKLIESFQHMRSSHSSWEGPSPDCRDCRAKKKMVWRANKAKAEGRRYRTRLEITEEQRAKKAERERRIQERSAELLATKEARRRAKIRHMSERNKVRRRTDPIYYATIQARKIRRSRALAGTQIVNVNREAVAERDGWRCGICGRRVSRMNWSIDHVVPLSQGGEHTYTNVVLAHKRCNSKRGAGYLPVQPSLLGEPTQKKLGSSPASQPAGQMDRGKAPESSKNRAL